RRLTVLRGFVVWAYLNLYGPDLETAPLPEKILRLVVILVLSLVGYFVFSYLFRLRELDRILELLKLKRTS
ncbi:MAG: hypothetical protein WBC98_07995, partial [Candidatus Zixiibacteriota bacterium]